MHFVLTLALVTSLAALLIVGFLSVAHDLLSRIILESGSDPNEANFERIDRGTGCANPSNHEIADARSDC
jgi:hypothetical protein